MNIVLYYSSMEEPSLAFATTTLVVAILLISWIGKHANKYLYERNLGEKNGYLPPGDYGLPIIGNMWSFLLSFMSGDLMCPTSFPSNQLEPASFLRLPASRPRIIHFQIRLEIWTSGDVQGPHVRFPERHCNCP
ncbi:hypothetical protein MLD38_033726 [Melastoma candidum]|uniref:Uncharacterized protein n=1 Tax=Melastoma candidum TaxID=119954 RepID=A0ACB9MBF2_9MYRT|nr:hypothetical protein MLD38_033726 [Melastoma candidum]